MSYSQMILPEFDHEMANTRLVLELVPEDKLGWQAYPSGHTIGWNANHLAEIPGWVEGTLAQTAWDLAPVDGPAYQSPNLTSPVEIVKLFDRNVASGRQALAAVSDEAVGQMWSLLQGGAVMLSMPRAAVIRTFVLNHTIHHRAILCTYLRINGVEVPGMYGP